MTTTLSQWWAALCVLCLLHVLSSAITSTPRRSSEESLTKTLIITCSVSCAVSADGNNLGPLQWPNPPLQALFIPQLQSWLFKLWLTSYIRYIWRKIYCYLWILLLDAPQNSSSLTVFLHVTCQNLQSYFFHMDISFLKSASLLLWYLSLAP